MLARHDGHSTGCTDRRRRIRIRKHNTLRSQCIHLVCLKDIRSAKAVHHIRLQLVIHLDVLPAEIVGKNQQEIRLRWTRRRRSSHRTTQHNVIDAVDDAGIIRVVAQINSEFGRRGDVLKLCCGEIDIQSLVNHGAVVGRRICG